MTLDNNYNMGRMNFDCPRSYLLTGTDWNLNVMKKKKGFDF